jgi:hypothetical protein
MQHRTRGLLMRQRNQVIRFRPAGRMMPVSRPAAGHLGSRRRCQYSDLRGAPSIGSGLTPLRQN